MNWANTIVAKSDQLNADDLMGGPITIKITNIKINQRSDQPAIVHYEGDNGKPYKPCKSMRRVMALKWGSDETQFIGKSMTLERDPTVKWAGEEVGGIRITHMSDMKNDDRFMLTYSKGSKKPYKVEHLKTDALAKPELSDEEKKQKAEQWVETAKQTIATIKDIQSLNEWCTTNDKAIQALSKYEELSRQFSDFLASVEDSFSEGGI